MKVNILHMTFKNNCDEGMLHEVPTPYTPQHNGVAERRNRTIMNMVRSMLKGRKLPKYFWGEAVSITCFILTRIPTRRLQEITPDKAWSRRKPNVSHLKIFGSLSYKHVPEQVGKKLDDRSDPMIFIGYHPTGAYKLYDPKGKKIVISIYVIVDESKWWNRDECSPEACVEMRLLEDQITEPELSETIQPRRPQRNRQQPRRLNDCEILPDNLVIEEGVWSI